MGQPWGYSPAALEQVNHRGHLCPNQAGLISHHWHRLLDGPGSFPPSPNKSNAGIITRRLQMQGINIGMLAGRLGNILLEILGLKPAPDIYNIQREGKKSFESC